MSTISEFHGYGKIFTFEPPVNVGQHRADSLKRIVAIAIMGPSSTAELIDLGQQQSEAVINYAGEDTDLLRTSLNAMLEGKHVVSVL